VCVCVWGVGGRVSDPTGSNPQCLSGNLRTHRSFEAKLTDNPSYIEIRKTGTEVSVISL